MAIAPAASDSADSSPPTLSPDQLASLDPRQTQPPIVRETGSVGPIAPIFPPPQVQLPPGRMPWDVAGPLISQTESNDRNIPNYRFDPRHTAGGYYQITDTNWRNYAPRLGILPSVYPSAMSAPRELQDAVAKLMYSEQGFGPWAPYNSNLRTALGGGETDFSSLSRAGETVRQSMYDLAGKETARAREAIEKIGKMEPEISKSMGEIRKAREQADLSQSKALASLEKQPKPPEIDGVEKMGGVATIVGILGGLLTRQPLIASLNAAGAAIGAYNDGDRERYKLAFDNWKTQNDLLFKIAEMQATRVRDIMSDEKFGLEERRTVLDLTLRAMGQQNLADEIRVKGDQAGAEWQLKIENAQRQKQQLDLQLEEYRDRHEAEMARDPAATAFRQWRTEFVKKEGREPTREELSAAWAQSKKDFPKETSTAKAPLFFTDPAHKDEAGNPTPYMYHSDTGKFTTLDGKDYTPGGVQKIGTNTQAPPTPESVEFTAQGISKYQLAPLTGWAMRSPFGQQVMSRVLQINPEYQATQFGARSSAARAFTSGRQSDAIRAFSVAIDHMATLEEIGTALQNGDIRALNALRNRTQTEFGYEGPLDFNFAKSIVGDEVTKAVIGGVGSVTDRQQLQEGFSLASSPEQLVGVIRTAKRLMAGQLNGFRRQYERGTGSTDFDTLLSPEAKRTLEEVSRDHSPSAASPVAIPAGIPTGSTDTGRTSGGKKVWQAPDGSYWTE